VIAGSGSFHRPLAEKTQFIRPIVCFELVLIGGCHRAVFQFDRSVAAVVVAAEAVVR
jgi:hypothetical protein